MLFFMDDEHLRPTYLLSVKPCKEWVNKMRDIYWVFIGNIER